MGCCTHAITSYLECAGAGSTSLAIANLLGLIVGAASVMPGRRQQGGAKGWNLRSEWVMRML